MNDHPLHKLDPLAYLHAGSPLEFKLSGAGTGELAGYASVFDDEPDSYNDRIAKGAFSRALAAADSLPMLLYHDPTRPAGVWTEAKEDARGLFVRGRLTLDSQGGKEAYAHVRAGSIKGLSIGYALFPGGFKHQPDGSRLLTGIDVREVSLVTLPAQRRAAVVSVKSLATVADLVDALVSGQLGRRDIELISRRAWPGLTGVEPEPEPDPQPDALLQSIDRAVRQLKGK